MSVSATLNGLSYTLPTDDETGWGTNVTSFLQAVASSTLQKSGGVFTLTADADFGASYGLKSNYFTTRTANAASAGVLRLARADAVKWRNEANGADLTLGVDSSNNLEWEGSDVVTKATQVGPSFLTLGFASSAADTTSRYSVPGGPTAAADTVERSICLPVAMTVAAISVSNTSVASNTCTFVVRKNGVDTALTLALASGAASGTATGTVSFAAGDRLSVKHTMGSATAGPANTTVTIKAYV